MSSSKSTLSERPRPRAVVAAQKWLQRSEALGRPVAILVWALAPFAIGVTDDYVGDIQLSVFYSLPIVFGTWIVGLRFGLLLIVLCVGVQIFHDLTTTYVWSSEWVPAWNALIRTVFYAALLLLVSALREMQGRIESHVRDRTQSLTNLLEETRILERELLEISDREQRRIGADLHDGLSQHLTGTSLTAAVLVQKLEARRAEEAGDARKISTLLEDAISFSRNVSKGLNPVELHDDALMHALRTFAANTRNLFNIECVFVCEDPVLLDSPTEAVHFFRIAQQSVTNAIRHGKAKRIVIRLTSKPDGIVLQVEDDGVGIPDPPIKNGGMGLRIMAHRANLIGATLNVQRGPLGGTFVTCTFQQDRDLTNDGGANA